MNNTPDTQQNILIVDDHIENLIAMEASLEGLDIVIFKADSGKKALSLLLENDFAIVLLDVMMPDMNGYELASLMKGNRRTQHIPIIFITALNMDKSNTFRGYSAGAVDFLYKPVDQEILISKVKVFIELHRQRQELSHLAEMLSYSQIKYKKIIETTDDAIFIADASTGIILEVNNSAERMLGLPKGEIVGMHQRELHPPAKADRYGQLFMESVLKGKAMIEYLVVVNKDGMEIPVDIRAHTIDLGDRTIIAGFFRDVTQRKLAEDVLRKHRRHLEELVQERTSELEKINKQLEAELEYRRKMEKTLKLQTIELTRSNAELEHFAYIASHDLQEPIRKVASFTELLQERYQGKIDEKADKFIAYIVDGTTRMKKLINDLLTYSRVGTSQVQVEEVDLSDALKAAMSNLEKAIRESNARITHARLPLIMANETRMVQLFQNLIGNAKLFRGKIPPVIDISCEVIDDAPCGWKFAVSDNGIGIPAEEFDRIFMMFHRLHGRGEYEGTGIGLPICKKIVERQGGQIWVESLPENGTTFYFTLFNQSADDTGVIKPAGLIFDRFNNSRDELKILSTALEQTADLIVITNVDGIIEYANPAFELATGYKKAEVTGKKTNLLKSGRQESEFYEVMWKTILGGKVFQHMFINRKKDGMLYYEDKTITPVLNEQNQITHFISIGRDVTQSKMAESTLMERSKELAHSNREIQQYAYLASHDLQEPLRTATNYAELLSDKYSHMLDYEAKKYINYILDGVKRMRMFITGLLAFSRITSEGKDFTPVDMNKSLKKAISNLDAAIRRSNALIHSAALPAIPGDAAQLVQLFQNLIDNAIKFRTDAQPQVNIWAKPHERDESAMQDDTLMTTIPRQRRDTWLFCISDNGMGIDNRYLERIFNVFECLHGRDDYEGTGIGLAICKKIVERHGGDIWAESVAGKGSAFYFTLPRQ